MLHDVDHRRNKAWRLWTDRRKASVRLNWVGRQSAKPIVPWALDQTLVRAGGSKGPSCRKGPFRPTWLRHELPTYYGCDIIWAHPSLSHRPASFPDTP